MSAARFNLAAQVEQLGADSLLPERSRGSKATKHPGRTPAQRRVLDAIGCGEYSPPMARSTRDALLLAGLIEPCGHKTIGSGPFAVRVAEYQMPIPVHMQWCQHGSDVVDGLIPEQMESRT